jgi:chromate transport protein ChrA
MQNNFGSPAKDLEGYASLFLRFGLLAWGGLIAQIAMICKERVEEEK